MEYRHMDEEGNGVLKTPTSEGLRQPQPHHQASPLSLQQAYKEQTHAPQVIIAKIEKTAQIPEYKVKALLIMGTLQLTLGIMLIILNIAALAVSAALAVVATGIWVGILVIITGSFGIVSSRTLERCYLITFMVLSIVSAVFVWNVIIFSVAGAIIDSTPQYHFYVYGEAYLNRLGIAMNSMLLILGFVEAISSIVASAFCCSILCCQSKKETPGQVVYQNYESQHGQQQQQYVVVSAGQYGMPATTPGQPSQNIQYVEPQMGQS